MSKLGELQLSYSIEHTKPECDIIPIALRCNSNCLAKDPRQTNQSAEAKSDRIGDIMTVLEWQYECLPSHDDKRTIWLDMWTAKFAL